MPGASQTDSRSMKPIQNMGVASTTAAHIAV